MLANRGEDVDLALQPLGLAGQERRILERVGLDLVDHRREPHDVDRSFAAIEIVVGQLELRQQEAREVIGARRRDFEAQRNAELPLWQFTLQRLAQVFYLLLVDPQVGVARHAKL